MNKAVNLFSGIFMVFYCIIVMGVTYDLSLSSNVTFKGLSFQTEICTVFAFIIFLLGVIRVKRKWQGAADMKRFSSFEYVLPVAKNALNLSLIFALVEAIFIGLFCYYLFSRIYSLSPNLTLPMIIVLLLLFTEAIIFSIRIIAGGPSFRVGINKRVVAFFNREMHLFHFTGLTRIEKHQEMINFKYKEDLNLLMPIEVIPKKDRAEFRDNLIKVLNEYTEEKNGKIIYIDDAFRKME